MGLGEEESFHPLNRGFQEFFGFLPGAHNDLRTDDKTSGPICRDRKRVEYAGSLFDLG